jgi:hypothetical protein
VVSRPVALKYGAGHGDRRLPPVCKRRIEQKEKNSKKDGIRKRRIFLTNATQRPGAVSIHSSTKSIFGTGLEFGYLVMVGKMSKCEDLK